MDEKKKRKLPRRQRKQHDRNDDSTSYQHEQHHPLSIYYRNRRSISFAELAQTYPDFCEAWERVKERQREKRINCKNRIRTELYENHHSSCNHDSSTNLACSSSSTTDLVRGGDTQKSPRQRQGKESFSTHVDYNFNLALTRSLLHRDFCGMVLPSMPPPTAIDDNVNVNEQGTQERRKNLCPPVPQRLNYVCWVKELLYCGMDFYGSSDSDDSDDVGSVSDADGVGKKGIDGQASNGEEREVDKGRGDNDDEVRTNDIQKDQQNDWDNEATTATRKRRENVVGKYLDARCQVGRSNRNDRIPGQLLDHVAHSSNKVGRRRSSALTMRGNGNTVSHHRGIDIGTGASCIFPLLSFATLEMDKAAGGAMEGHNDIKTDMKCQRNPMADDTTEMWKFLATDVDELSVQCARKNVSANHLDNNVHVALVQQNQLLWRNGQQGTSLVSVFDTDAWTDDFLRHWIGNGPRYNGPVMAAVRAAEGSNMFYQMNNTAITCSTAEPKGRNDTIGQDLFTKDSASPSKSTKKDGKNTYDYLNNDIKFDFVMTNPPFYASDDEAAVLRRGDQRYRTDMSFCESTYPNGGEVGFVMDMIHDSLYLRQRISWYTSMLGRKSSLDKIRKFMRRLGLFSKGGVRVTEFVQGKACRWGIAWTFLEVPARLVGLKVKSKLPKFDVAITNVFSAEEALNEAKERIIAHCNGSSKNPNSYRTCKSKFDRGIQITVTESPDPVMCSDIENLSRNNPARSFAMVQTTKPAWNFLIDFSVRLKVTPSEAAKLDCNSYLISISHRCFSHSARGKASIQGILGGIVGEIRRTNRKWIRKVEMEHKGGGEE